MTDAPIIPFVRKEKENTVADVRRKTSAIRVLLDKAFDKTQTEDMTDNDLRKGLEGARLLLAAAERSVKRNKDEIVAFIAEIERRQSPPADREKTEGEAGV